MPKDMPKDPHPEKRYKRDKDPAEIKEEIESAIQTKMRSSEVFQKSEEVDVKRKTLNHTKSSLEAKLEDLKDQLHTKRRRPTSRSKSSIQWKRTSVSKSISKKLENSRVLIQEIERFNWPIEC